MQDDCELHFLQCIIHAFTSNRNESFSTCNSMNAKKRIEHRVKNEREKTEKQKTKKYEELQSNKTNKQHDNDSLDFKHFISFRTHTQTRSGVLFLAGCCCSSSSFSKGWKRTSNAAAHHMIVLP